MSLASTSSIPRTGTARSARLARSRATTSCIRAGPRRSSATGSPLVAGAGSAPCWRPSCTAMDDWPNEDRLSALNIRRTCNASLRRLRTDYIDLYQMHHVDRGTPWDEIWQAMEVLVAQGKILYAGSSNFAGWHIAQANDAAVARDFFVLVSEQSIYNLMTRDIELDEPPLCSAARSLAWSPGHARNWMFCGWRQPCAGFLV